MTHALADLRAACVSVAPSQHVHVRWHRLAHRAVRLLLGTCCGHCHSAIIGDKLLTEEQERRLYAGGCRGWGGGAKKKTFRKLKWAQGNKNMHGRKSHSNRKLALSPTMISNAAAPAILALPLLPAVLTNTAAPTILAAALYPAVLTNADKVAARGRSWRGGGLQIRELLLLGRHGS